MELIVCNAGNSVTSDQTLLQFLELLISNTIQQSLLLQNTLLSTTLKEAWSWGTDYSEMLATLLAILVAWLCFELLFARVHNIDLERALFLYYELLLFGTVICDRLCENRPCSHLVVIRETLV